VVLPDTAVTVTAEAVISAQAQEVTVAALTPVTVATEVRPAVMAAVVQAIAVAAVAPAAEAVIPAAQVVMNVPGAAAAEVITPELTSLILQVSEQEMEWLLSVGKIINVIFVLLVFRNYL